MIILDLAAGVAVIIVMGIFFYLVISLVFYITSCINDIFKK